MRGGAESAGLRTGPVGTWTFAHKHFLRLAVVIAGGLTLTFWSRPTVAVVVVTALVVLLAIGLVELLGRPPSEPGPAEADVVPAGAVPRQREPVAAATTSSAVSADEDASSQGKETTPHG